MPVLSNDGRNWLYTFATPTAVTDVTYVVKRTTDLVSWTTTAVQSLGSSGGLDAVQANWPISQTPRIIFRLRIAAP